ncbi:MAG TPA: T9SS type A sorting domain-containing protein, partial [Chitinophagales bacterium]|nr:T9SS type A sorting domain-containing protein [Chitinophagales bacterium]
NGTKSLSRINYPNKKGKACDFRQHEVPLFATNGIGTPNFPRLRVDEIDVCDSTEQYTDLIDIEEKKALMRIYPNPVKDIAKIQSEEIGKLYLYDVRGVLVKSLIIQQGSNYLDMQAMDNGFYFINFINKLGGHYGTKIFKTDNE